MLEDDNTATPGETTDDQEPAAKKAAPRKTAAKKAAPARKTASTSTAKKAPAKKAAAKKTTAKKAPAKKAATAEAAPDPATDAPLPDADLAPTDTAATQDSAPKKTARKPAAKKPASRRTTAPEPVQVPEESTPASDAAVAAGAAPLFQAPDASQAPPRRSRKRPEPPSDEAPSDETPADDAEPPQTGDTAEDEADTSGEGTARRRRRRGGRRRRKSGGEGDSTESPAEARQEDQPAAAPETEKGDKGDKGDKDDKDEAGTSASSRRRRRRRRSGDDGGETAEDDPQQTVTKVRKSRSPQDQITAVTGSTRLEAKKQRRREGREAGRRRAPIVSEAEFLARRESVDRVMAIRQRDDLTQIAVLEDKVLVEHYVARESQTSLIGNVYLGRVQNVLPSMEAAFIDIGKGRNAVLYAGEVNWSALGHQDGQPRKIESVLSSGQSVLVQVTKDPVGHKGARLTSQISLAGRFLVYVPDGTNSGISRKLPDTERNRLKSLLKEIVPEGAGVIVRTAAEGASEEELTRDVERLAARWTDIEKKAKGSAPQLLYGEPDLMLKVVRDLFTEDFSKLAVQGDDAWDTVQAYVSHVAPDLEQRLERYDDSNADLFAKYRIDEQIHKGLDRKVWLPSGGSLIIDRTEAMTVVDVNTGKFTGSGGNLEETVTKNNLEAAEEIVRQLRLRDIGGIIVVDFIDMVLESNRDLVLRRLVECLGRDRTRHQVAEVTSLGLVQMTRKRIGTGLLEAFSETCEHCGGRGVIVADAPVEPKRGGDDEPRRSSRRSRRGRGGDSDHQAGNGSTKASPSPKDVAAMSRPAPKPEAEEPSTPTEEAPAAATAAESEAPADTPAEKADTAPARSRGSAPAEPTQEEPPVAPADDHETSREPEQPVEPDLPAEPAPPRVVTRTRRRSASRPAGPPSGSAPTPESGVEQSPATHARSLAHVSPAVGSIGAPPADGNVEPGTSDAEPAPPQVEHVPVKKRGSRKR